MAAPANSNERKRTIAIGHLTEQNYEQVKTYMQEILGIREPTDRFYSFLKARGWKYLIQKWYGDINKGDFNPENDQLVFLGPGNTEAQKNEYIDKLLIELKINLDSTDPIASTAILRYDARAIRADSADKEKVSIKDNEIIAGSLGAVLDLNYARVGGTLGFVTTLTETEHLYSEFITGSSLTFFNKINESGLEFILTSTHSKENETNFYGYQTDEKIYWCTDKDRETRPQSVTSEIIDTSRSHVLLKGSLLGVAPGSVMVLSDINHSGLVLNGPKQLVPYGDSAIAVLKVVDKPMEDDKAYIAMRLYSPQKAAK